MAALSRARPTVDRAQYLSRAKGAPRDLSDLALVALAPAISQMREAQNGIEAATILDEYIPEHIRVHLAVYMIRHGNMFNSEIVAAAIQCVGWEALARSIGEMATEAAFHRFCLPALNAATA